MKKNFLKFFMAVFLALLLAGIIEAGYNYHSLIEHYEPIDITWNYQENKGNRVYSFESENPVYIKKIQISGHYEQETRYHITYTSVNDFGVEEEKALMDTMYPQISVATTNIGEKVNKMEITVANKTEVDQVLVSNEVQINKYRVLLYFLVIFSFYLILFEREFLEKKLEYFFLIYALLFGVFLILIAGPRSVTWDEEIHYERVCKIASDQTVEWSRSADDFVNRKIPSYNTKDEFAQLKNYLNSEEGKELVRTEKKDSMFVSYDLRTYIPMAIFYQLAKWFHLSFSNAYMFGKLGNLFLYVILIFWAIRLSKKGKIFITAISLMPTVLFQGSMYTYDGMVYAFLVLGCVLWKNEFERKNEKMSWYSAAGIIGCIILGSLSKAIYIPLLLGLFLFPTAKFADKKTERIFKGLLLGIFLLVLWTFVIPAIANTVAGNLSYGGDARGGDTSTVRQMISMLKHPFSAVKLLIENITSLENFRNVGRAELDDVIASNLMFLAFGGNGVLSAKWSLFLLPLLGMLFFIPDQEDCQGVLPFKTKFAQGVILLLILALIWTALYLSFTPVGQDSIDGVQARYYLPLLLPLAYITWGNGFQSNLKTITYRRITLCFVNIFMFQCIYQLFLMRTC